MAPSFTLDDIAFTTPTTRHPYMSIAFRTPSADAAGANPIHPATGLQLSFRAADGQEIFAERLAPRDVAPADDGACRLRVAEADIPRFSQPELNEVDVVLHAWKGEKLLGSWEVGRIVR